MSQETIARVHKSGVLETRELMGAGQNTKLSTDNHLGGRERGRERGREGGREGGTWERKWMGREEPDLVLGERKLD
jgi:hypothetical protein